MNLEISSGINDCQRGKTFSSMFEALAQKKSKETNQGKALSS